MTDNNPENRIKNLHYNPELKLYLFENLTREIVCVLLVVANETGPLTVKSSKQCIYKAMYPEQVIVEVIEDIEGRYLLQKIIDLNPPHGCASNHNGVKIITKDQIVAQPLTTELPAEKTNLELN